MGDPSHDYSTTQASFENPSADNQSKSDHQHQGNGQELVGNGDFHEHGDASHDDVFQIVVKLPQPPYQIQIMVSRQEQVQDLRQTIMESSGALQYSCFHLEMKKQRINDFVELSEVADLAPNAELTLVEDPYNEREARLHFLRTREIAGLAGGKVDSSFGIEAGISLHDSVCSPTTPPPSQSQNHAPSGAPENKLADYNFDAPPSLRHLTPSHTYTSPKILKSLQVSSWNPPPPHFRQLGHLLYLQLTTHEGELFQITSHITGFFVNKSTNSRFDPLRRTAPKEAAAHSLLTLISTLSPSFETSLDSLLRANGSRDPLVNFQMTNAVPASPWVVDPNTILPSHHSQDIARTQENSITSGPDGTENLRDWNEELQSTRELPRDTVQERVFRERLIGKTYAEFTDAAVKGAVLVARGEITPLNPTEVRDAQIFVHNNIFYSFGADGVGTFTSDGGDEAARVAVGKDVKGVKTVNALDIKGLSTAGTIVVDYLGRRIVAQSIVPGIFKQREPGEHQVDYGGVEGRDIVADDASFVPTFSQVSKLLKIKPHPVWDEQGKRHDLEGSVETKGLLGTDGRKYILDLYRLTPLDISWIEGEDDQLNQSAQAHDYPHRMTVLRPELVDTYWRVKLNEYVKAKSEQNGETLKDGIASHEDLSSNISLDTLSLDKASPSIPTNTHDGENIASATENAGVQENLQPKTGSTAQDQIDSTDFTFSLNPDVFCGQNPDNDVEKEQWLSDESDVRAVCSYLHQTVFTELFHNLFEADAGFPMDGISLTKLLHKRGINIRYLGKVALLAGGSPRGNALRNLAEQEMVARAFKHEASKYLKRLANVFAPNCLAHLLNCLLSDNATHDPRTDFDQELVRLYPESDMSFLQVDQSNFAHCIRYQVQCRYRYELPDDLFRKSSRIPLLRSICLKLGIQLIGKNFNFEPAQSLSSGADLSNANGSSETVTSNGHSLSNGTGKKKKKNPPRVNGAVTHANTDHLGTFSADDIACIVPIVKDSSPKSVLAEEALEAGKISLMQNQKDIGQELLLESLTLHEQIYGVLHPEVARVYHQLAMMYFQMDEKAAAIELAHKAVIISERTLGLDSAETILSYLNLALFEHGNRNTVLAVSCVRHALDLWTIIYGHEHPFIVTTLNNAAVMLQHLQNYQLSRAWFEKSLFINEKLSGRSSVSTATLLFQLAQALVLDGDHKGAVHKMREAFSIFHSKLGPEDVNTKESEMWLEQLTQHAVSMAKHAKDVQSRRIRKILFNPRAGRLTSDSQPQMAQNQANLLGLNESRDTSTLDSRSIDDLLKFIEGGGDIAKTKPSKRTARRNPRRRGGASIETQS